MFFDLSSPRRLHVVGAGGGGMSAITQALAEMGHRVSGSDLHQSEVLDRLKRAGVTISIGHHAAHVEGCDAVTSSTAVPAHVAELTAARESSVEVLNRAQMLAAICHQARSIGIAGTHGKTTTASMVTEILDAAGWEPGFVIGAAVAKYRTNGRWTGSDWFVVEADESDRTHLALPLFAAVLTNIDVDHLDTYGSLEGIEHSFASYLSQVPGPKVVGGDDERARRVGRAHGAVLYGTSPDLDVRAVNIVSGAGSMTFDIERDGARLTTVELPLRGLYNVLNATGALTLAMELGIDPDLAADALSRFGGVARRFDIRGRHGGATFVDDYAHLGAEIKSVLGGARESADNWKRIVAVFQPNRYHRIAAIADDYADAFEAADLVVITDIYSSGTTPIPGVTGELIVKAIQAAHPDADVRWIPDRSDLIEFAAAELGEDEVCISMGCGDIETFPDEVVASRREVSM